MKRNTKIDLISILLIIVAVAMIVIGYKAKIPAPALTGIGFLLITWGIQALK